jgi:hypothetical protein
MPARVRSTNVESSPGSGVSTGAQLAFGAAQRADDPLDEQLLARRVRRRAGLPRRQRRAVTARGYLERHGQDRARKRTEPGRHGGPAQPRAHEPERRVLDDGLAHPARIERDGQVVERSLDCRRRMSRRWSTAATTSRRLAPARR